MRSRTTRRGQNAERSGRRSCEPSISRWRVLWTSAARFPLLFFESYLPVRVFPQELKTNCCGRATWKTLNDKFIAEVEPFAAAAARELLMNKIASVLLLLLIFTVSS